MSKPKKCPAHSRPGRPPKSAANCPACLALQVGQPAQRTNQSTLSFPSLPKGPTAPATSIEEAALALQRRVERTLGISFSSSPSRSPAAPPPPPQTVRPSPPLVKRSQPTPPIPARTSSTPPPADTKKPTKCPKHRKGRPPRYCAACEAVAAGKPLPEPPDLESPRPPSSKPTKNEAADSKPPKRMRLRLSNGHSSGGTGGYSFPLLRLFKEGFDLRGSFTPEEWAALKAAWANARKERNIQYLGQELEAQIQIETLMPMRYPETEREEVE